MERERRVGLGDLRVDAHDALAELVGRGEARRAEDVPADDHVAHRARLVPVVRVAGDQDGGAARLEVVLLDHDLARGRHEDPARAVRQELVPADDDVGRPGQVLERVALLHLRRHRLAEADLEGVAVARLEGDEGALADRAHRAVEDEADAVARVAPAEAGRLVVHEAGDEPVGRRSPDDAHARAVDVHGVVHEAVEARALDRDEAAAVGDVDAVVVAGEHAAAGRRHRPERAHGQVLGELGEQAQPGVRVHRDVLDRHVARVDHEDPGVVALAVAEDEQVADGRAPAERVAEAHEAGRELLGAVAAPALAEAARVARAGHDLQGAPVELHCVLPLVLPALADEDELPALDHVRVLPVVEAQVQVVLGRRLDHRLRSERDVPVDRDAAEGDPARAVHRERLHPVVEDEGRARAVDRQAAEALDEDGEPLRVHVGGVRLEVVALGRVLRPEVVAALREDEHRPLELPARLERSGHRGDGVRAAVGRGAEVGDPHDGRPVGGSRGGGREDAEGGEGEGRGGGSEGSEHGASWRQAIR